MPNYYALSIGPVTETIEMARNTRDTWASSYLLSYMIELFCDALKKHSDVLSPNTNADKSKADGLGAGLYPDRIFARIHHDKSKQVCDEAIAEVIDKVALLIKNTITDDDEDNIKKYIKSYFRIVTAAQELQEDANLIFAFTPILDLLEQRSRVTAPENDLANSPLRKFTMSYSSDMLKRAFNAKKKSFESIPEIAAFEFTSRMEEALSQDDDNAAYDKMEDKFSKEMMQYHKYFCVVYADGDNVGQLVQKLNGEEKLKNFSAELVTFAANSTKIVKNYGGAPVYMGGDDMFFFAPVKNGTRHIFNLLANLEAEFESVVKLAEKLGVDALKLPTLSYGITIGFYKYPLYELRKKAFSKLFYEVKATDLSKNSIGVHWQKHSGQSMPFTIPKLIFQPFAQLVDRLSKDKEDVYINSLVHKLADLKHVLKKIFELEKDDQSKLKNRVNMLFNNSFDEIYDKYEPFFKEVASFIIDTYFALAPQYKVNNDVKNKAKDDAKDDDASLELAFNETLKITYAALRFVHFLKQPVSRASN